MRDINFRGKKIAVLGLGIEGESSVKFLRDKGTNVTVLDEKENPGYLNNLDSYDVIVRSPGIKLSSLKNYKGKITSQTKLFFDLCPCPVIGVTGTKGKGTTSSLIYEMLKAQGKDAYLGGNIGVPPLSFLEKLNKDSIVVLELSSFQLQDMTKSPHIAIMLMTTSEHLNWHKDVGEYVDAKRNILRYQQENDFAILNKDYLASRESDVHTNAKVFYISKEDEVGQGCFIKPARHASQGDAGGDGRVVLRKEGIEEAIIDVGEILLPGRHNLENVCAATMAAFLAGASIENIARVLRTFKGLEHRLELVREVGGVKFYDDSFSTTPETAIAAIEAFTSPEILILGGASKNSDFSLLGQVIFEKSNIKAIIGIGVEWERIKSKVKSQKSKVKIIEGLKDMKSIVKAASEIAQDGDVVLLTPACSSFDMFKNYKDRGQQFKKEVSKLVHS